MLLVIGERRAMDRYEYRIVQTDIMKVTEKPFEAQLNQLGSDGWKLESTVQHERHGYSHEVAFLFSRPLSPAPE
jgi:hypothetical protein